MNARVARQVLRGYRPSGADDDEREVREALKIATRTPALQTEFQNQLAFDRELAGLLDAELPAELAAEIEGVATRLESERPRRFNLRDPAMLTVGISFLVIVGLLAWVFMGKMSALTGMQDVIEMVQNGDKARADQFQPVETNAGALNDWFVMQSFDGFAVPAGMESAPVVGVRILKLDEAQVAVAAVTNPKSLCYVFEAAAFHISLPERSWRIVKYGTKDRRAFAITRLGAMAFVIVPREEGADALQKYIDSLSGAR
ncbi:MAG: hypothetical protein ACREKL_06125 [Chthoniobacterales bacterium]